VAVKLERGLRRTPEATRRLRVLLLPGVQVGGDLGTEVDDFKLGLDPCHEARLSLFGYTLKGRV